MTRYRGLRNTATDVGTLRVKPPSHRAFRDHCRPGPNVISSTPRNVRRIRRSLCHAYCRISARGTDTSSLSAYSAEGRMDTPEHREAPIRMHFGAGLHTATGQRVDDSAYYQYIGRWSRLFVPAVLAAAEVRGGDRVLDVATGPGEAVLGARAAIQPAGGTGHWHRHLACDAHGSTRPARRGSVSTRGHGWPSAGL